MLLEIAIGDAYGAGFEYADEHLPFNDLTRYLKHPRHPLLAGQYTDDTQMSLAIAEMVLSNERWTQRALADRFVNCFKRDQREGYAPGFYDFLCGVNDGGEFLERIRPESDKSGAAMRATPIGLLPTLGEVIEKCEMQARLTHNTTDGVRAALAAAAATHYLAYGLGPKAKLGNFLVSQIPGQWNVPWIGRVKLKGWMSVQAAITVLQLNDTMSGILRDSVAFGGDVDTVAAIAMGAACCCREIAADIPPALVDGLEDEAYGKRYLRDLDQRLARRFPNLRIVN